MSITFYAPDAPNKTEQEPCPVCEGSGIDEVMQGLDCPYCNGKGWDTVTRSTLPEINMSNANAYDFLARLGIEPDCCGRIEVADMPTLETKLTVMSMGLTSVFFEKEPETVGNFHFCGRDHEYVVRRSSEMLALVKAAMAANYRIIWG